MSRPTSFDHVCCLNAMMACHARRSPTVCAAQGRCVYATPNVVRPCVLPKGGEVMPCLTSFDRVCCPRAVMSCHARRSLTVCVVQRR